MLKTQKDSITTTQKTVALLKTLVQQLVHNIHPLRLSERAAMAATANQSRIEGFGGGVSSQIKAEFIMEYCKRKFLDMNIPTTRHNLHATIMIFDHGSDAARFPKSFKEDKVKHQDKGLFASPELPKCVQESQQPLVNPRHALDWPSYTMDRKTIKINWDKKIIHLQSTTMRPRTRKVNSL